MFHEATFREILLPPPSFLSKRSLIKDTCSWRDKLFVLLFYCGMIRLRNTNLDVFIQLQHTRNTLRKANMAHNLFKKDSKFQKFNEILYCGMTRFRNVKLVTFRQYQNIFNISKKKNVGQKTFKEIENFSKFKAFKFSSFTLTW